MTSPRTRPDRSGFRAAIVLWLAAIIGVMVVGIEVTEDSPRRWFGHWIANIWAFTGWIPILILARSEPQPPEDRQ